MEMQGQYVIKYRSWSGMRVIVRTDESSPQDAWANFIDENSFKPDDMPIQLLEIWLPDGRRHYQAREEDE